MSNKLVHTNLFEQFTLTTRQKYSNYSKLKFISSNQTKNKKYDITFGQLHGIDVIKFSINTYVIKDSSVHSQCSFSEPLFHCIVKLISEMDDEYFCVKQFLK